MRFFSRSLIGLFLLAVTIGILALAGGIVADALQTRLADKAPGRAAQERVFSANVTLITPGDVVPLLTAFGEVRARRTLELRAPAGGKIVWLADGFEDGGVVAEGQPLLRLDPADATTARDIAANDLAQSVAEEAEATRALDLAKADLAAAQVQANLRAQALARQEDVRKRGIGSDAAVEVAALATSAQEQAVVARRQALSAAENRIALAATTTARHQITLAEAARALADTEVVAKFAGRLDAVTAVEGGIVSANEQLATIIDPDALEVSFRLSTAQFARLVDADGILRPAAIRVALESGGIDLVAPGRLVRASAAVGAGQTGRLVYATLDAAPGFRPGDFVTVQIEEPVLSGAVALPATAISAASTVLALTRDDRLEEIEVTALRREGDRVILEAGALAGREVVTDHSPLLGAGIRIKPVRDGATPADEAALIELTPERRAELVAWVQANTRMPADAKARVLEQLAQDRVPAQVIARLEQRMGG